ncbi:BufA1 family periplasmic bufferin-type metallophore [Trinickia mobilis]|uniref:BufA1 family periplasmic bufferin-type metallophore n=1 Tax=Trinickia mobilis TaxID=2816356 RepID=UPI001A8F66BB
MSWRWFGRTGSRKKIFPTARHNRSQAPTQAPGRQSHGSVSNPRRGQNDCTGNNHACAGQGTKGMHKGEFGAVHADTCRQMGGSLQPGV